MRMPSRPIAVSLNDLVDRAGTSLCRLRTTGPAALQLSPSLEGALPISRDHCTGFKPATAESSVATRRRWLFAEIHRTSRHVQRLNSSQLPLERGH